MIAGRSALSARIRVSGAITMRLRRSRSPIRTGVRTGWVMLVVMI
jgi:hypothetical protein